MPDPHSTPAPVTLDTAQPARHLLRPILASSLAAALLGLVVAIFVRWTSDLPAGLVMVLLALACAFVGALLGRWGLEVCGRLPPRRALAPVETPEMLRQFITQAPFLISVKDLDGRLLLANKQFETLFGFDADEIRGASGRDLFPAELAEIYDRHDQRVQRSGKLLVVDEPVRVGADERIFSSSKFPLYTPDGLMMAVAGIGIDVTQSRHAQAALQNMEAQLAHVQRMESIGRLAGGVAHDYNNLLTAIIGYADMALNQLDESHPVRDVLLKLKAVSGQSSQLTQQLLSFARKDVISPVRLDLHRELRRAHELIVRLLGPDVQVEFFLEASEAAVLMDQGQLTQLLMNMATNARYAMPDGGRLSFSTRNSAAPGDVGVPKGWVDLLISDTGGGIPPDVADRIFEPFFTGKSGTGTGLGLSTCYGILRQNGGDIVMSQTSARGTTFRLRLPVVDDKPESQVGLLAIDETIFVGKQILLVEDDDAVREVAHDILDRLGCEVLSATGGAEALHLIETRPEIFLLLTDVVMPAISGLEVAEAFRERHPFRPILFVSGYAESQTIEPWLLKPGVRFAAKPYRQDELLLAMYKASQGARRASSGQA